jgi:membrane protease YdiL (CAAX protease family)
MYAAGDTPFRWEFAQPHAVVGPPLGLVVHGIDADGLHLSLIESLGDVGLRLSGRRIDPQALPHLELRYRSERPLRLRLASAPDLRPALDHGKDVDLPSGLHTRTLPLRELLPADERAPLAQLRLWLQGTPGQLIQLHTLRLLPAACAGAACLPARVELPLGLTGARALAARDAVRAQQPQALIGMRAPEPLVAASSALQALGVLPMALFGALLLAAGAGIGALRDGPARSTLALLLGAGLPIALLGLGLPRFPDQTGDALLLGALALALWLARPQRSRLNRTTAATAWRQALGFTALGLLGLVLAAVLSEGPLRWPAPDRLLRYAAFAVLQQLWLARFALPHLQRLGTGRFAVPAAALLFAGLHLPNLELMVLTALAGFGWAVLAQRHGRLWPQVVSHVVLGLAAVTLLPPELLRSAEVGGRFVLAPT